MITLGQTAESLVHVFQHFGFSTMCTQRFFEGTKVGQPLPMQAAQLVELRPENLEIAAGTKRLVGVRPNSRVTIRHFGSRQIEPGIHGDVELAIQVDVLHTSPVDWVVRPQWHCKWGASANLSWSQT
ncbi:MULTISPECIES: hypothetical protein [Xanthomonas]|uniref:Uncharacterized protein n=3 Tax=Xanthomonas TaxID=338 RepID=A0A8I2BSY3_XANMN|nr:MULTISPECIES: hypothetical protein [Xanthomonas]KLC40662.1 hypothetical protein XP1712_22075 [Xanthomonas perforans]KUF35745.1 hypothetical protein AO826_20195 [Xanthomonas phaseoli pv. manihotis]MBO9721946.1 hypothetical protein [Xanthomonas phaseoli pv. manihotis]MBO9754379.1 hypothetical protein [Xanthomonas phaseoli pv. manihotis]MBO9758654.1 hypothetical protein [Xanthomonas phaseoli pv. manihotis]